ncbi:MAG: lspA [Phenylobacterium sp.]|nr:lspA [Phenylobacterium sp.]
MSGVTRFGWTAYGLAAVVIALDQAVKAWILGLGLRLYESRPVAGILQFTLVPNTGVSFGFLRAEKDLARWALVGFSLIVAAMIVWWARRAHRPLQALGYGLICGGAVGNAIDRARFGWVVDFIDVQKIGFFPWIFNVADSAITVGVIALLLDSLRREPAA